MDLQKTFSFKESDLFRIFIFHTKLQVLSCEIGYNQEYIKNYLTKYNHIEFYYDYSSLIRGFIAYKK